MDIKQLQSWNISSETPSFNKNISSISTGCIETPPPEQHSGYNFLINESSLKSPLKHIRSIYKNTEWKESAKYLEDENTTNEGCSLETKSENSVNLVANSDDNKSLSKNDYYEGNKLWKNKYIKLCKNPGFARRNFDNLCHILLSAVHELYEDQLRPTFPELRRRLRKYKLPASVLKNLAESYKQIGNDVIVDTIKQEVLLRYSKGYVIDPKSPHDTFSCCDWAAFQKYVLSIIQSSTDEQCLYTFEGGRYGMASKMLQDPLLKSERLSSMSIGSLCHLIQLSIAYGIMQYENNILRPRATCLRIGAAYALSDLNIYNASSSAFMALEKVKVALKKILREYPHAMLLSQLKLAFENKWSTRLCQSVFGYTRLSTLLQKDVFKPICRILIDNYSRIFIQSVEFPIPSNMTILNYDNSNAQFLSDERSRRTMSISFSEERRCCCRPIPYFISYYSWQSQTCKKINDLERYDSSTIELGLCVTTTPNITYTPIVKSVLSYLDL